LLVRIIKCSTPSPHGEQVFLLHYIKHELQVQYKCGFQKGRNITITMNIHEVWKLQKIIESAKYIWSHHHHPWVNGTPFAVRMCLWGREWSTIKIFWLRWEWRFIKWWSDRFGTEMIVGCKEGKLVQHLRQESLEYRNLLRVGVGVGG